MEKSKSSRMAEIAAEITKIDERITCFTRIAEAVSSTDTEFKITLQVEDRIGDDQVLIGNPILSFFETLERHAVGSTMGTWPIQSKPVNKQLLEIKTEISAFTCLNLLQLMLNEFQSKRLFLVIELEKLLGKIAR